MIDFLMGLIVVVGTVIIYVASKLLYKKISTPLLLPVAVSTVVIIIILLTLHISYETYMIGGKWINELLGPAVVALAYPLYRQLEVLKKLAVPIIYGTFFGAIVGVSTGIVLAKLAGFDHFIIYSLSPKSVTTPVAMDIAQTAGGATSLAAVFVMIAGIGGTMMSAYIYKIFKINHVIGRGVGIGCASHAIGTAKAMESSQVEGSISTIAMVVSAVFVSVITPGLIALWM